MINTLKYLKYSLFLPILFIQFSCDSATAPTVYNNGDYWDNMLDDLSGRKITKRKVRALHYFLILFQLQNH